MGMGMGMTIATAWASVNGNEGNCTVYCVVARAL